jgi:hypothetical protein
MSYKTNEYIELSRKVIAVFERHAVRHFSIKTYDGFIVSWQDEYLENFSDNGNWFDDQAYTPFVFRLNRNTTIATDLIEALHINQSLVQVIKPVLHPQWK